MKSLRVVVATLTMFLMGQAIADPPPPLPLLVSDTMGTVERWSPSDGVIRVSGSDYPLSSSFYITDSRGQQLASSVLRRGLRVQLTEANGEIQSIVVLPRSGSAAHQLGQ